MPGRPGRFMKALANGTTHEIVTDTDKNLYRVFNPSRDRVGSSASGIDFEVQFGSTPTTQPVVKGASVDVYSDRGKVKIKNASGSNGRVRGMYDIVSPTRRSRRDGQFKFEDTSTHVIIDMSLLPASKKVLYRILNSGEHSLTVTGFGSTESLPKKRSIDILVTGGQTVTVQAATSPGLGIFEFLEIR